MYTLFNKQINKQKDKNKLKKALTYIKVSDIIMT